MYEKWGSVTNQMAVPVPSISCCVLNHHNLFYQIQIVLAFNWDTCCHLALCLQLLPSYWWKINQKKRLGKAQAFKKRKKVLWHRPWKSASDPSLSGRSCISNPSVFGKGSSAILTNASTHFEIPTRHLKRTKIWHKFNEWLATSEGNNIVEREDVTRRDR